MTYIRQLDTVRAFAVILVTIEHWSPKNTNSMFPLGTIGVDIFFVLSGFLITRILLLKKIELEEPLAKETKVTAVGKFMMRRSLRIFPIYYLMLLILYLGASYLPNPIPDDWEYYALYVQNFLFYVRQSFPGGKVTPFWSLAVEEQFYLVWPWLLFFVPAKFIKHVLISGIFIGVISSLLFPSLLVKKELIPVLTPTCLQAFCVGGFLSFISIQKDKSLSEFYPILRGLGIGSLCIYVLTKLYFIDFTLMDRFFIALFTSWVISVILLKKTGMLGGFFDNNILISIGRVSYGIYGYHNFVPVSLNALIHYFNKHIEYGVMAQCLQMIELYPLLFHVLCALVLCLIAFSSYYFFEKPLLGLKKYFE